MDGYICSKLDLPNELYRVDYPGSRTTFSSLDGFTATDTTRTFGDNELNEFKCAIEKQFTWSCREPLPFISLFSDREHAENWGLKEPWRGIKGPNGNWSLHVIDTTKIISTIHFFKLSDLVEELDLDIPKDAGQHIRGAFLCLHRIPTTAILESRNPREVKEDQERRREKRYLDQLEAEERGDYLAEYSGSEREALQENYNTIFEKNIEDNW